tara:strand:+ start:172 stop:1410 length:1239 start_codon:yes stop_codon:yes gene_type:complete
MNQPDFDSRIENRLIGTLIHSQKAVGERIFSIKEDYFIDSRNRSLLPILQKMYEDGYKTDTLSIYTHCTKVGILNNVGGGYYITGLDSFEWSELTFQSDKEYLIRKMRERKLAKLRLSDISHSELQQEIMDIFAEDSHQDSTISLEEAIKGLIDTPEADGIKTGFLGLDNLLGGFNKGEMVVIAARPSIGKSALALSMIKNMANENISGLYISLEMSYKELAKRLVLIDIQKDDIFLNNIFDYQKYKVELGKLYELPIYIVNEYNSSISGILKVASNLIRTRNIGILFIDHLQLVFSGKKAENRNLELSGITSILKQFALKENIVAVVLSQVGRQCDGRMPTLSDLRDSGAIEQDADKVILLNRPAFYGISTYENGVSTAGICDLKIAKNRNGPIGESRLKFLEKYTAFENP